MCMPRSGPDGIRSSTDCSHNFGAVAQLAERRAGNSVTMEVRTLPSSRTWRTHLVPFVGTAMPGITGIIGRGPPEGRRVALDLMARVMQHEAFYSSCVYCNDRLGLDAAWVVHQGGFSDCNAVWNETKNIGLIFTGEEFSDPADISALRAKGHQFHADDASCLVHWYEELGPAF